MLKVFSNVLKRALPLLALVLTLPVYGDEPDAGEAAAAAAGQTPAAEAKAAVPEAGSGVVARVGEEQITYGELNRMLNSSAMVGLSVPALGTRERSEVIITLLDKAISANLLYLDAIAAGTDQREPYVTDIAKFENAILASLYEKKVLIGDIGVSEDEVQGFYKASIDQKTELTDDVKLAIEAKLRKRKLDERKATSRERLREGVKVEIDGLLLSPEEGSPSSQDVVATVDDRRITWSEVETLMRGADYRASLSPFYIDDETERRRRLEQYIDNELMAGKARAAGLEQDADFIRRTKEYRKTHLINVHRGELLAGWKPSADQLQEYFLDHMDQIRVPESRKVQMVVVATREEAEDIKRRIEAGEITIYQAAQQYSLDPTAKQTLGEMGWVSHGSGFTELDDYTFGLEPEAIGGPVESPAGWHLIKVQDVTDAQFENIEEEATRQRTLRLYMKAKLDAYVVGLRKERFKVAVYEDELTRQFQKEADYIAELQRKAAQPGSVTEQRQQDLQKWIGTPQP